MAYFLVGLVFGGVLMEAEVMSWFRIQEMFRFDQHRPEGGTEHEVRDHSILGRMTYVAVRPPAKKPQTAMSDASCLSASPAMACPDVQPPA